MALRNRSDNIPFARTHRYVNSFFPYTIKTWKNLDEEAKMKSSVASFKKHLNKYIRPSGHAFFRLSDKIGIKLLTKIRVGFSDLREQRFNHNFNCKWSCCRCGLDDETSVHFLLCCPMFADLRASLLSKVSDINHADVSVLPSRRLQPAHLVSCIIRGETANINFVHNNRA